MATIKSYTTIEQSRKLAEFLPLESADMYYHYNEYEERHYPKVFLDYQTADIRQEVLELKRNDPCWSLAALLGVLPDYTLQTNTDGTVFAVCEGKKPMISDVYNNPVDACYELILKLNELNLL